MTDSKSSSHSTPSKETKREEEKQKIPIFLQEDSTDSSDTSSEESSSSDSDSSSSSGESSSKSEESEEESDDEFTKAQKAIPKSYFRRGIVVIPNFFSSPYRVYIENLTVRVNREHIFELFQTFGKVLGVYVPKFNDTLPNHFRIAIVQYGNDQDCDKAVKYMDTATLDSLTMTVSRNKPTFLRAHHEKEMQRNVNRATATYGSRWAKPPSSPARRPRPGPRRRPGFRYSNRRQKNRRR